MCIIFTLHITFVFPADDLYMCLFLRFSELSSGYLSTTRVGRYDAGISPSEQDRMPQPPSCVDCFAFGVLSQEVLSAFNKGFYQSFCFIKPNCSAFNCYK